MELYNIPSSGKFGTITRKLNDNFYLLRVAIGDIEYSTRKNKGMFATSTALNTAIPTPSVGDWALVGNAFPADLYVCTTAGTWTDSGEDYDGDNISFNDYVLKSDYDLFKNVTNGELVAINEREAFTPEINDGENDFDIRDENGYIVVAFVNGHIKTKNFDSENIELDTPVETSEGSYDFSIEDENGNTILGVKDGQLKTKKFDSEQIKTQIENGNYEFSIEDENGNVLVKFANGHIKTKNFDSSNISINKTIYCIGDSTTQGQQGIDNPRDDNVSSADENCYPNRLQDMLGNTYNVVNLGCGGQNTSEILARCGFLDLIVKTQFVLYGNGNKSIICSASQQVTEGVLVDSCCNEPANYLMQQGTEAARMQMTSCYINGVQCALSFDATDGNLYVNRTESVSYNMTIPVGTHITLSGNKGDGIYLLRMGTNDVLRLGTNTNVDNYIKKLKQATSLIPNGRFVVMGMFHGYEPTSAEYQVWESMNEKLSQAFGTHFIDGKSYITSMTAFAELGITPTSDGNISSARAAAGVKSDEYCMANGITPSSFWRASKTTAMAQVDKIHLNKDGYILMAKMFYDKIKQLNYI